jgi:putative endonuclease
MLNLANKELGKLGENLAAKFLQNKGYQILQRNYVPQFFKQGRKEIDIVAKKDKVLVFVEVKTIEKADEFFPEDKVDFKKQQNLLKAAENYLIEKKIPPGVPWQVDVIGIILNPGGQSPKIEHFENAIGGY